MSRTRGNRKVMYDGFPPKIYNSTIRHSAGNLCTSLLLHDILYNICRSRSRLQASYVFIKIGSEQLHRRQ